MNCCQCNFRVAAKGSRYCLSNSCSGDHLECPVAGCPGFMQREGNQHISLFCKEHERAFMTATGSHSVKGWLAESVEGTRARAEFFLPCCGVVCVFEGVDLARERITCGCGVCWDVVLDVCGPGNAKLKIEELQARDYRPL